MGEHWAQAFLGQVGRHVGVGLPPRSLSPTGHPALSPAPPLRLTPSRRAPLTLEPPALVPVRTCLPSSSTGKTVSLEETFRAVPALRLPSAHPRWTRGTPPPKRLRANPWKQQCLSRQVGWRGQPGDSAFLPGWSTTLAWHEGYDSGSSPHPRVPWPPARPISDLGPCPRDPMWSKSSAPPSWPFLRWESWGRMKGSWGSVRYSHFA